MSSARLNKQEKREIEEILKVFRDSERLIQTFKDQLFSALENDPALSPHVHSFRSRIKDPDHLRAKLERKFGDAKKQGVPFGITPANLLTKINDLVGIRILHLYTRQISLIDNALRGVFEEHKYTLLETPFVRTWDDESRDFFKGCGFKTEASPSMYTSVHYVVGSNSKTVLSAEIQVRTLMEEVWGEVDHTINYPLASQNLSCREQLKVLARVTSSATRLVDSIFLTHQESKKSGE